MQVDVNPHILRMFKDTFSHGAAKTVSSVSVIRYALK